MLHHDLPNLRDGFRVLRTELSKTDKGGSKPPFAFMYRYAGSQHGAISLDDYRRIDDYMHTRVGNQIGLPIRRFAAALLRPS